MRDAARALDDVSDHLGEVLRRADDLLAEWSRLGTQVHAQVEREAAAVGEVVEGAIGRAATAGIDRAIADRLRALTVEIERLEQRARAASRAVVEQRDGDRRILWGVVAGVVLANALLVVLLLRRPEPAPAAEAVRLETPAAAVAPPSEPAAPAAPPAPDPTQIAPAAGSGSAASPAAPAGTAATGSGAPVGAANAGAGSAAGSGAARPAAGSGAPAGQGATRPADASGLKASPIAVPPRPPAGRPHKKLP